MSYYFSRESVHIKVSLKCNDQHFLSQKPTRLSCLNGLSPERQVCEPRVRHWADRGSPTSLVPEAWACFHSRELERTADSRRPACPRQPTQPLWSRQLQLECGMLLLPGTDVTSRVSVSGTGEFQVRMNEHHCPLTSRARDYPRTPCPAPVLCLVFCAFKKQEFWLE